EEEDAAEATGGGQIHFAPHVIGEPIGH
ncbi:MAG: hypothetical protein JWQ48_1088, partial [Conexibacter sp.]|nr:hypothetical protein [Conexibacter sp.]